MINNFFKTIHNKYNSFFRFIFFLRYLLAIFILSIAIFLIIPNFFNYEKRSNIIKSYLLKNYNFTIISNKNIRFKSFPIPTIEMDNVTINTQTSSIKLYVENLKLRPKIISIYDYNNFQTNKIILKNSNLSVDVLELKTFKKNFLSQNKKLFLDNFNLTIRNSGKKIIEFKNIQFSNYGYNKNLILGKVFNKKFKTKLTKNFNKINFDLEDTGFSSELSFDANNQNDSVSGIFKTKILNTNIKFNFFYDGQKLEILNSYFRNKNISFNNDSLIFLKPFLDVNSNFIIDEVNFDFFKKLDLEKILNEKEIIKKINSKNNIKFFKKKLKGNLIDEINTSVDLAYGRLNYKKKILISKNVLNCEGNINLLDEYPLLFFDCLIVSENTQKFLKEFSINKKYKMKNLNLNIQGNLNILNKKINFSKILSNDDYEATDEDLKYFKETFEKFLFNKSFLDIFNYKKIKKFIFEIS